MAERVELTAAPSDVGSDECSHHWMIATPNGETSEASCKICGATRDFLNYSQRKVMTRSVKPAANTAVRM